MSRMRKGHSHSWPCPFLPYLPHTSRRGPGSAVRFVNTLSFGRNSGGLLQRTAGLDTADADLVSATDRHVPIHVAADLGERVPFRRALEARRADRVGADVVQAILPLDTVDRRPDVVANLLERREV